MLATMAVNFCKIDEFNFPVFCFESMGESKNVRCTLVEVWIHISDKLLLFLFELPVVFLDCIYFNLQMLYLTF